MRSRLFTVGHSTRSSSELLDLLREHGVRRLVDVRRHPGSKRYPHFGKDELSRTLEGESVEYRHEPDLGGRRPVMPDSPNAAWRNRGFRGYADHMASEAFRSALDRLLRLAADTPTVILCAEAVPWRCHRNLIADAAVARGTTVQHILGPGQMQGHVLNTNAVLGQDGILRYPGAEQPGLLD